MAAQRPSRSQHPEPESWHAISDRILVAAARCMARWGLKVSMQDVAVEAGVSRGALYRHFAGRPALVEAVMERNADDLLAAAATRVDDHGGLASQIAEGIRQMTGSRSSEPLATALDNEPWARAAWLVERWQDFWVPRLTAAQERGEVRGDLVVWEAADWIARVQLSFLAGAGAAGHAAGDDLERYVGEHLLRGIGA